MSLSNVTRREKKRYGSYIQKTHLPAKMITVHNIQITYKLSSFLNYHFQYSISKCPTKKTNKDLKNTQNNRVGAPDTAVPPEPVTLSPAMDIFALNESGMCYNCKLKCNFPNNELKQRKKGLFTCPPPSPSSRHLAWTRCSVNVAVNVCFKSFYSSYSDSL